MALTSKQQKVFEYIQDHIKKYGHAPTQRELAAHFKLKSVGTMSDHIRTLRQKGYLTQAPQGWANLEVAAPPQTPLIPLLGEVAAGRPLERFKFDEKIEVPSSFLKGQGSFFALQVSGDSMIDEGILDRDYVVVKKQSSADQGQIVVALIDGEATIKKFFKKKSSIELHSANEKYRPLIVKPLQHFQIEGIFCGLLRY